MAVVSIILRLQAIWTLRLDRLNFGLHSLICPKLVQIRLLDFCFEGVYFLAITLSHVRIMNDHNAIIFTLFRYHASTCFGIILAHHQEANCIMWQWYFFYF
jgi:hypothetical protein